MSEDKKGIFLKSRKGDREAFIQLMAPWQIKLYALAFYLTKDEKIACDWLLEANLRLFVNIKACHEERIFNFWVKKEIYSIYSSFYEDKYGDASRLSFTLQQIYKKTS